MLLRPFLVFLERLAKEIESDQLEAFKFMLEGRIPAGPLEECSKPRQLFSCMMRHGLLEENKLEFLEELLSESRKDLLCRIKDFRPQFPSSGEVVVIILFLATFRYEESAFFNS